MIILDTNVLSELMRPKPSPRVVKWVSNQLEAELFTTTITEAEIFYGIELLAKGKRRGELLEAADAMFAQDMAGRIFSFESDSARAFGFRDTAGPWQTDQPCRRPDRSHYPGTQGQASDP